MEIKKNAKVNLEKYKVLFFLVGMVAALTIVLILFESTTTDTKAEVFADEASTEVETEEVEVTVRPEELPPPPPPQQVVSDIINIVEDNVKIEDEFDFELPDEDEDTEFVDTDFDTEEEEETDEVFLIVEKMPEFPGGEAALRKFIAENVVYPPLAQENDIFGKVYIRFVVTKTGAVGEVQVVRSVDKLLDDEAIRVVGELPNFKPGKQRGKPVSVWYTVPIDFQLN